MYPNPSLNPLFYLLCGKAFLFYCSSFTLKLRVSKASPSLTVSFFNLHNILKDFIYFIFRERGREGERERNINAREKHRLVASHTPPTWIRARNPGMCPKQGSNLQPFAS